MEPRTRPLRTNSCSAVPQPRASYLTNRVNRMMTATSRGRGMVRGNSTLSMEQGAIDTRGGMDEPSRPCRLQTLGEMSGCVTPPSQTSPRRVQPLPPIRPSSSCSPLLHGLNQATPTSATSRSFWNHSESRSSRSLSPSPRSQPRPLHSPSLSSRSLSPSPRSQPRPLHSPSLSSRSLSPSPRSQPRPLHSPPLSPSPRAPSPHSHSPSPRTPSPRSQPPWSSSLRSTPEGPVSCKSALPGRRPAPRYGMATRRTQSDVKKEVLSMSYGVENTSSVIEEKIEKEEESEEEEEEEEGSSEDEESEDTADTNTESLSDEEASDDASSNTSSGSDTQDSASTCSSTFERTESRDEDETSDAHLNQIAEEEENETIKDDRGKNCLSCIVEADTEAEKEADTEEEKEADTEEEKEADTEEEKADTEEEKAEEEEEKAEEEEEKAEEEEEKAEEEEEKAEEEEEKVIETVQTNKVEDGSTTSQQPAAAVEGTPQPFPSQEVSLPGIDKTQMLALASLRSRRTRAPATLPGTSPASRTDLLIASRRQKKQFHLAQVTNFAMYQGVIEGDPNEDPYVATLNESFDLLILNPENVKGDIRDWRRTGAITLARVDLTEAVQHRLAGKDKEQDEEEEGLEWAFEMDEGCDGLWSDDDEEEEEEGGEFTTGTPRPRASCEGDGSITARLGPRSARQQSSASFFRLLRQGSRGRLPDESIPPPLSREASFSRLFHRVSTSRLDELYSLLDESSSNSNSNDSDDDGISSTTDTPTIRPSHSLPRGSSLVCFHSQSSLQLSRHDSWTSGDSTRFAPPQRTRSKVLPSPTPEIASKRRSGMRATSESMKLASTSSLASSRAQSLRSVSTTGTDDIREGNRRPVLPHMGSRTRSMVTFNLPAPHDIHPSVSQTPQPSAPGDGNSDGKRKKKTEEDKAELQPWSSAALMLKISDLIRKGFDGVFLAGVGRWLHRRRIQRLILHLRHGNRERRSTVGSGTSFRSYFLLEGGVGLPPHLVKFVNGFLFENRTLRRNGHYRLLFGTENSQLEAFYSHLKSNVQRRRDFNTFMVESLYSDRIIQPELVKRLHDYCEERKIQYHISVDQTFSNASKVMRIQPGMGWEGLLKHPMVQGFLSFCTRTKPVLNPEDCGRPLRSHITRLSDLFTLPPMLQNDPRAHAQALGEAFTTTIDASQLPCSQANFFLFVSRYYEGQRPATAGGSQASRGAAYIFRLLEVYERWACAHDYRRYLDTEHTWKKEKKSYEPRIREIKQEENPSSGAILPGLVDIWADQPAASSLGYLGQKEMGCRHNDAEYQVITQLLVDLRVRGLLRNISSKREQELYTGDEHKNSVQSIPDPTFTGILEQLDDILTFPPHLMPILMAFRASSDGNIESGRVVHGLRRLRTEMTTPSGQTNFNMVHLWEANKFAFGFRSLELEKRYLAIGEKSNSKCLHIHISSEHPNFLEAIIHVYFLHLGFSRKQCLLLECLARRRGTTPASRECTWGLLSHRMEWQIRNSSYRELAMFIQRTSKAFLEWRRAGLSDLQTDLGIQMVAETCACARFYLVDSVDRVQERTLHAKWMIQPPTSDTKTLEGELCNLEERISALVSRAMWDPDCLQLLLDILVVSQQAMAVTGYRGPAISLLQYTILHTARRVGFHDLLVRIRDATPYQVREPDVATVICEMLGKSEEDIQHLFQMNKHDLGALIHKEARTSELIEDPNPKSFERPTGSYKKSQERSLSGSYYLKKYVDGLFFFFPFLVNQIFVMTLGIGVLTNQNMDPSHQSAVGLGLLCAMMISGAMNGAVTRIGSHYVSQWSHHAVYIILVRILTASILISVMIAFCGGIAGLLLGDWFSAVVFFVFTVGFGLVQILTGALFSMHRRSIWRSPEGIASTSIFLVSFLLVMGLDRFPFLSYPVVVQHMVGLVVWVLLLLIAFLYIAHSRTVFLGNIRIRKEKEVIAWYSKNLPPEIIEGLGTKDTEQMVKASWDCFAAKVEKAMKRSFVWNLITPKFKRDAFVEDTVAAFSSEEHLVHWFCLLTEKARPIPWTRDWYTMLAEAMDAIRLKYKTDDLFRTGVLWDMACPNIIQGFFYFMLLFCDRLVRVVFDHNTQWFTPSSVYESSMTWAQIYALLALGAMEALVNRIHGAVEKYSHQTRVGREGVDLERSMRNTQVTMFSVYWKEAYPILYVIFGAALISAGAFYQFGETSLRGISIFVSGMAAYTGIVFGSFNAIFLGMRYRLVAIGISIAATTGWAVGCLVVGLTHKSDMAVVAIAVGGWLYFLLGLVIFAKVHNISRGLGKNTIDILVQTYVCTTGQRWVGDKRMETSQAELNDIIRKVSATDVAYLASPSSSIGDAVIKRLKEAFAGFSELPKEHILRTCFPDGSRMLQLLVDRFQTGRTKLVLVPEVHLYFPDRQPTSAVGRMVRSEMHQDVLQVFVGTPSLEVEEGRTQAICEAMVHETMEHLHNMPHKDAVVAELLVSVHYMGLPARISRQIHLCDDEEIKFLERHTDEAVLNSSLMGFDIDREWERVAPSVRQFLVWILEASPQTVDSFPMDDEALRVAMDLSPRDFHSAVDTLFKGHMASSLVARACVRSILAIKVKAACTTMKREREVGNIEVARNVLLLNQRSNFCHDKKEERFGVNRDDNLAVFLHNHPPRIPWRYRIFMFLDTFGRLAFTALTADHAFHREMNWERLRKSRLNVFERYLIPVFFVIAFKMARTLFNFLVWTPLLVLRKPFETLNLRFEHGLNRTTFYRRGRKVKVFLHNFDQPQTAYLSYHPDKIAVNHYPGLLEAEDEPREFAGRTYQIIYHLKDRWRGASPKLFRRLRFDKQGNATETSFFSFDGPRDKFPDHVPTERRTYKGEWKEEPEPAQRTGNLIHTLHYNSRGEHSEAVFVGPQNIEVHAKYTYVSPHPADCMLEEARYTILVPQRTDRASMTVEYNPLSQNVKSVLFKPSPMKLSFHSEFIYKYQTDHEIITNELDLRGEQRMRAETPLAVEKDTYGLIHLGANRPSCLYVEDLVAPIQYGMHSKLASILRTVFRKSGKVRWYTGAYPANRKRTELWRAWGKDTVEGIFARLWDESIMRQEPTLREYWKLREWLAIRRARDCLRREELRIAQAVHMPGSTALRSHFMLRISDLEVMGKGGDSRFNDKEGEYDSGRLAFETYKPIEVLGLDSGTWPADGGGVASCRRDIVDRLDRLRFHQIAEVGNPMKQVAYQVFKNVKSMTLVPLWGTELAGPTMMLSDGIYGEFAAKGWMTSSLILKKYFVPLLWGLAYFMQVEEPTEQDVQQMTILFLNIYTYFQRFDWVKTWYHPAVNRAWLQACFHMEDKRKQRSSTYAAERPTVEDVNRLLNLVMHFFMPFTIELPRSNTAHATHHGLQAVLGVVAKFVHGSGFAIWDHGVMWRERIKALAEITTFSLPVRNGLVGLTRMAAWVNMYNADVVVPCTSINNPEWEAHVGAWRGNNRMWIAMRRKISPVVNGMETDRFFPKHEDEEERPTAVMLSHVYDLKDIKNALRAAAVIVKTYEVNDYHLLIYGSLDKDQAYVTDCHEIIMNEGLANNVTLAGLGAAPRVLPRGWIFLNSSKSEGLPLALGEAGLAGLPAVCTDVGGSREVVGDGRVMYGRCVPPRNPEALARAQLEVLAMLGELDQQGAGPGEGPSTETPLTLEDFAPLKKNGPSLLERMCDPTVKARRHRLAMQYRAYVISRFALQRYLREHEQVICASAARSVEFQALQRMAKTHHIVRTAFVQEVPGLAPQTQPAPQTRSSTRHGIALMRRATDLMKVYLHGDKESRGHTELRMIQMQDRLRKIEDEKERAAMELQMTREELGRVKSAATLMASRGDSLLDLSQETSRELSIVSGILEPRTPREAPSILQRPVCASPRTPSRLPLSSSLAFLPPETGSGWRRSGRQLAAHQPLPPLRSSGSCGSNDGFWKPLEHSSDEEDIEEEDIEEARVPPRGLLGIPPHTPGGGIFGQLRSATTNLMGRISPRVSRNSEETATWIAELKNVRKGHVV